MFHKLETLITTAYSSLRSKVIEDIVSFHYSDQQSKKITNSVDLPS